MEIEDLIKAIQAADETFGDDHEKFRKFILKLINGEPKKPPKKPPKKTPIKPPRPGNLPGGSTTLRYGTPM